MSQAKKSIRTTVVKWSILTLLLAYTTWVTIWAHAEADRDRCTGIDIRISRSTSADSITRAGVLDELGRYPKKIIGSPISSINTRSIRDFLAGFDNFESVECVLTPHGELRVNIVPMIPEIRVFSGNESYYVNKDGKRITSNAEFFVDVPVVRGNFTNKFTPAMVLPLTRFINNDPSLRNLVAMVEAQDSHNLILVPRIQGHVINFGDTSDLAGKRDRLLAMYRKVMPYKGWEEYDTISVKFKGMIVATRRNKDMAVHTPEIEETEDLEEATLPTADGTETEQPRLAARPDYHVEADIHKKRHYSPGQETKREDNGTTGH